MLRECKRVLKRSGKIAGYLIHTPGGLSAADQLSAAEMGPSDVASTATPEELTRSIGLSITVHEDVTDEFTRTCEAIVRTREKLEQELRAHEGDALYDEEQEKKHGMLKGISEGLLLRSLIVATKE